MPKVLELGLVQPLLWGYRYNNYKFFVISLSWRINLKFSMNLPQAEPEFEVLLDYLKHNKGCDLTSYKRSTLLRRFQVRMQSININSYQDYLKYLQSHDDESRYPLIVLMERNRAKPGFPRFTGTSERAIDPMTENGRRF